MSNQSRQEFRELLGILIPDNTPKTRAHFPGADISPARKLAFIEQFMTLWDKCNAESTTSSEPVKAKRQYRKSAPKNEASTNECATETSDGR